MILDILYEIFTLGLYVDIYLIEMDKVIEIFIVLMLALSLGLLGLIN